MQRNLCFPCGPSATTFSIPVTLSAPAAQAVTVYFSTTNGTATSPTDYVGLFNSHITIAASQTTGYIPLTVKADPSGHGPETFTVTLVSPLNAILGAFSSATVTILYQ